MIEPSRPDENGTAALSPSTLEFLNWVAARPRTYADVMEAWQTSCPRLSIWEDCLIDGLVERQGRSAESLVVLTEQGRLIVSGAA
jgi:hypothetical protein